MKSKETSQSKSLDLGKGISVRSMPLPPKGFDPRKADPKNLLKYGYPNRPDGHPQLMALWERNVLGVQRVGLTFTRPTDRGPRVVDGAFGAPGASPHFAGTSTSAPYGYELSWVAAEMTVPNIYPRGPEGSMNTLVAITNGSSAMFSTTGVSAGPFMWANEREPEPSRGYYFLGQIVGAFNELPNTDGLFFAGFDNPVQGGGGMHAGDLVSTMICLVDPTSAMIFYSNLTSGVGGSALVQTPSGRSVAGSQVHWHVERNAVLQSDGSFRDLPDFGRVYFGNAIAFAKAIGSTGFLDGQILNAGERDQVNLVDALDRTRVRVATRVVDAKTIEFTSMR